LGQNSVARPGFAAARSTSAPTNVRYRDAQERADLAAEAALRLAYREAAQLYADAARIIAPIDTEMARTYRIKGASSLRSLGLEFGENDALTEAIDQFKSLLSECDRAREPFEWARLQVWIGIAAMDLGERESGTARLEQAIAKFLAAM
jgi:hypothetical protein